MLASFQAQLEQYPAPWISQEQRLLQDRNQPRLLAQLNPCRSPRRSMSASTIRPIRHSAPSSLSVVTRSHEADLIIPGELIPSPSSGSIPELPHVAEVGAGEGRRLTAARDG